MRTARVNTLRHGRRCTAKAHALQPDSLALLFISGPEPCAQRLAPYLTSRGVRVTSVGNDEVARLEARTGTYDCFVLDLGYRSDDAVALVRGLRAQTDIPIVLVVATKAVDLRVAVLEAGADDCVAVPFGERELLSRIQASVRRARRFPRVP
jgi:DNA-binding response OmpR family regulator